MKLLLTWSWQGPKELRFSRRVDVGMATCMVALLEAMAQPRHAYNTRRASDSTTGETRLHISLVSAGLRASLTVGDIRNLARSLLGHIADIFVRIALIRILRNLHANF